MTHVKSEQLYLLHENLTQTDAQILTASGVWQLAD